MKYRSTRGKVQAESFEDVLFSGYASDGGLFMPERIPLVDKTTLEKWKNLSYLDLSKAVMSLFIPPEEIPAKDLDGNELAVLLKTAKYTIYMMQNNNLCLNCVIPVIYTLLTERSLVSNPHPFPLLETPV